MSVASQPPQPKTSTFRVIPLEKISEHESIIDPRETSIKYRGPFRAKFAKDIDIDLFRPKFMIDDNYVGVPPDVQVSINNLNDNIDDAFLRRELVKFGEVSQCEIIRHPTDKTHLGLAKVTFDKVTAAKECVNKFHGKSFMGKKISVFLDPRYNKINTIRENIINPPTTQHTIPAHQALIPPTVKPNLQFPSIMQSTNGVIPKEPQFRNLEDRISFLLSNNSGLARCVIPSLIEKHPTFPSDYNKPTYNNRTPSPIENIIPSFNNEFRKDAYNRNERNNHNNSWSNHRDNDKDDYNHNHRRRLLTPPRKQQNNDYREEKAVVQREIPKNLTRSQVQRELSELYKIFENKCREALCKHFHKRIIEEVGYPLIDSEQAKHEKTHIDRKKNEVAPHRGVNHSLLRHVLGSNYSNTVTDKPSLPTFINRRTSSNFSIGRKAATDENVIKRVNRSTGLSTEQPKQASRKDSGTNFRAPTSALSSSSESSSSGSESDSDSDSDSDSEDSSNQSSLDSSSPSRLLTSQKQANSLSSQKPILPTTHDSSVQTRPTPRDTRLRSEDEGEVAHILANLGSTVSTENSVSMNIENDIREKDEMMDYSEDEDLIVKTSKKRKKEFDELFQTERQLKRIKASSNDLDKIRDIPRPSFDIRSDDDQNKIIDDVIGIDEEAFKFLMEAYDSMCLDPNYSSILEGSSKGSEAVNRAHLPFKPTANLFVKKKRGKDKKDDASDSPGWWKGCSRCDGFPREKDGSKVWKGDIADREDLTKAPIKARAPVKGSTRSDLRGEQRRFAVAHAETLGSAVFKFMSSSLKLRSKNLRFSLSKIHKWGLFACEKIAVGSAVIEYVGEKIRPSVADHREKVYATSTLHDGSSYFFRVDDQVIDATLKGNKARFINHSCNPNCIAKVIRHDNGQGNAIVIYANKPIEEEEEITYDYKFPREEVPEEEKIRCNCRAGNCQKFLN